MPTIKVVNFKGEVVGDLQLSDGVFAAPIHTPAMHQVVVAQLANLRQGTLATKTRGDVRGGGKKPWRQKHTGRARHGSSRSPIWVGGGVVHGPQPRDYHQKVNRKVRQLALKSALSLKVKEDNLVVIERFDLDAPSTRAMRGFFDGLKVRKPLILMDKTEPSVILSARNLPGAKVLHVDSINVYDLLNHGNLVVTADAIKKLEEVYA